MWFASFAFDVADRFPDLFEDLETIYGAKDGFRAIRDIALDARDAAGHVDLVTREHVIAARDAYLAGTGGPNLRVVE